MSDLENVPQGRNPQDPAGTQPRYDPEALLPSDPVVDDVVDADIVDEREAERGDLLPARRRAGDLGDVAPAKHSTYAPRFHFLTGALVAVGLAALAGLAVFIAIPRSSSDDGVQHWSSWTPTTGGTAGAEQIAQHVGQLVLRPDVLGDLLRARGAAGGRRPRRPVLHAIVAAAARNRDEHCEPRERRLADRDERAGL